MDVLEEEGPTTTKGHYAGGTENCNTESRNGAVTNFQ